MYLSPLYSKERTEAEGIVYSSLASRKKILGEIWSLAYVLGYTKLIRLKLIEMEILVQTFHQGLILSINFLYLFFLLTQEILIEPKLQNMRN